jgi:abequosyltransferase
MMSENANNRNLKLSIAIPTYNGSRYIREALDSIIYQLDDIDEEIEIVISDNASTDKTSEIIKEYQKKYPFVKYFHNEKNLGADRNFDLAVRRSKGKYVWLLSDNDKIMPKGIGKVLEVIHSQKDLAVIAVNYDIFDEKLGKIITDRVIKEYKDMLFESADDFWNKLDILSALVSVNIVCRSWWNQSKVESFYSTNWVHVGAIISILPSHRSFFLSSPIVRISSGSPSWEIGGNGLRYSMMLEDMFHIMDNLEYNKSTYNGILKSFCKRLPMTIISAKRNGLILSSSLLREMYLKYANHPSFWLIDLPLILLPIRLYNSKVSQRMYRITKRSFAVLRVGRN